MPTIPSHANNYYFRVNLSCAESTDLEHRQRLLFEIVRTMLGTGTGWTNSDGTSISAPSTGWTVVSSSDSVAADATNRWEALTDLVWANAGVAHSWIQLRHQNYFGTNVPLYVLFDCTQGGSHRNATLGVFMSRNEFTEGGITDRPTADEEVEVRPSAGSLATAAWQGPATNDADHRTGRLHGIISTDGRHFRAVICRLDYDIGWLDLFRDTEYDTSEWSLPACFAVISPTTDTPALAWGDITNVAVYMSRDDVSVTDEFGHALTIAYDGATPITELAANSGTGASGWDSIGLASRTPAANALRSAIPDAWWGRSAEPDAVFGSPGIWQQFTNIVIPWNTSIVQKS